MARHRSDGNHKVKPSPDTSYTGPDICFARVILRFILLRISHRPLLSPPIPERDIDPASLPLSSIHSSPTLAPTTPSSSPPPTPDHLRNNRVALQPSALMLIPPPPGRADTSVEDYLLPKALTTASVRPSLQLVKPLTSIQDWTAEVVYVLRPLVYGRSSRHPQRSLTGIVFQLPC